MNNISKCVKIYKEWLGVFAVSFAVFIFNTTEFIPIGLLPDIAESFNISEANIGLLITSYAWVVTIMSLPLTILTAHIERRKLMIWLFIVFVISHIVSGFAWNFAILMASRIGIAFAHSIFWAIAVPLAVRMAPNDKKARAVSFIVLGSSFATIIGVPTGTLLGHYTNWRTTFLLIALCAIIIMIILTYLLPKLPSLNAGSLKSLPPLLSHTPLMNIYLLTIIIVTAYFTMYSYITPFMIQVGKFSNGFIVFLLLVIGMAGITSSAIFSKFSYNKKLFFMASITFFLSLALFSLCPLNSFLAIMLCFVFGICMCLLTMSLQTKVLDMAQDASDVATSIYSAVFNIGIGGGALAGSFVLRYVDISFIGYAAALFALLALLVFIFISRRYF
ncbi:MAG: sugar transporter [Campylobacteraceae bacterium]|jgi:DHA1 family L-arabinose/isopropyl-beta-D-thiogalactopyranoside export protein-like MFS transporter|nr:sugar transporter [Campylobacteraceae bacterium]